MQFFFFFQAEDGIRDLTVTGVQTCALPIWAHPRGGGDCPGWLFGGACFADVGAEDLAGPAPAPGPLPPLSSVMLAGTAATMTAAAAAPTATWRVRCRRRLRRSSSI